MKSLLGSTLVLVLMLAAALAQASGYTPYSIGPSTGTTLIVLSAVPATFQGISITSVTTNGTRYKCWNSTTTSGLTFNSPVTLGAAIFEDSQASPSGPWHVSINASRGVVCGVESADAECVVYLGAY